MGLTHRGWATLVGGAAVIVVGRIVGLQELFVIGVAMVAVTVLSGLVVRRTRLRLQVSRDVRPSRVPVDSSCRVELQIRNTAPRRSPVLVVSDPVGDGQRARLRLAPLAVGQSRTMRYRLPVHRRGIVSIGPLAVECSDPFGLARQEMSTSSTINVIVLPRIVPLAAVPPGPGDEPDSGVHPVRTMASAHEEFSSLRDFQPGDDVRKVHWPSTARSGTPIVRHYDEPWQRRTTVVLDVRHSNQDDDTFERCVSAAASVVSLCASRGELVRLITTGGHDTGFMANEQQVDATMDLLAGISLVGRGSLTGTLRSLIARRVGGTLVTCTGRLPDSERSVLATMGSRFGTHIAVSGAPTTTATTGSGSEVVLFDRDGVLSQRWAEAVERLGIAAVRSSVGRAPTGGRA
jgi:uncharacterized protein (DUF58 family)